MTDQREAVGELREAWVKYNRDWQDFEQAEKEQTRIITQARYALKLLHARSRRVHSQWTEAMGRYLLADKHHELTLAGLSIAGPSYKLETGELLTPESAE